MKMCFQVLKESSNSRFDSYSRQEQYILIISHITFRDCRVHIFSDNLSRNSCICVCRSLLVGTWIWTHTREVGTWQNTGTLLSLHKTVPISWRITIVTPKLVPRALFPGQGKAPWGRSWIIPHFWGLQLSPHKLVKKKKYTNAKTDAATPNISDDRDSLVSWPNWTPPVLLPFSIIFTYLI